MGERDLFERRLESAMRTWAASAPTEVDAAALARSLAAGMPRGRRIARVPTWRLPSFGLAWAVVALVLLASLSAGLVASGALRSVHLPTLVWPSPQPTRPAVEPTTHPSTSAPPASAPSSPSTTSSASPAPGASPAYGAALSWTGFQRLPRLHPGQALTDPIIGDVTAGGPGFVAVGSDWVDAEGAVAVAWTSQDGTTWGEHQIGVPGPTGALSTPALSSIAAGDGSLVAAGRVGIWHSADGSSWEQSAAPHDLNGTPLYVAAGAGGFVAVGRSVDDPCQGRAWLSSDGVAWEAASIPEPAVFCPTSVAHGTSGFLATGRDPASDRAALLVSSDGIAWSKVPNQPAFDGQGYPEGALWTADRWTAFGSFQPSGSSEKGVQVWQSVDGQAWTATDLLRPTGPFACESVHMLDATAFGQGFVAVGQCVVQPEQVGIAWTSTTGARWDPVLGRVRPMSAVASGETRLVAVGSEWPDHQPVVCAAVAGP